MSRLGFKLEGVARGSKARAGSLRTLHNEVQTPIFMPVGTQATVRGQRHEALEALDFQVLLANTYHLMLRPGADVFRKMGGIQKFMGWGRSVLTDSGGFQIFSLPNARVMTEEGARFRSYVDNSPVMLTPETSIETQKAIGSDIMMVLDQCINSTAEFKEAEAAMQLTHRWAQRSLVARGDSPQSLFGIVQGACFPDLRRISADVLTQMPFDGFAIGGLAVGEGKTLREDMTELTADLLPSHLPRYLMGVGTPIDLLEAVHRGVDMFDCILPTALAQQGVAFTSLGRVDLRRGVYRFSENKLDPQCDCIACTRHSLAYLHHLIRVKEGLGWHLLSSHNLYFYRKLMREMRAHILADTFIDYYHTKRVELRQVDRTFPITQPSPTRNRRPARELGKYEVHESNPGVFSIRHIPSGEVMHSVNEPTLEARALYVGQSKLTEKIRLQSEVPLVLWDVGLGAAINAMAAIRAYEEIHELEPHLVLRPLQIVSFENDLDSLRLALRHPNLFKHLRHAAPATLVEKSTWKSKRLEINWTLLYGEFQEQMHQAPTPDLIYFDPFSARTDSAVWTVELFKQLFSLCVPRATELYTYSSSTAVRASLLGAGFFVGHGMGTGPRAETTIALTPQAAGYCQPYSPDKALSLLSPDWLSRWERSAAKFPLSVEKGNYATFEEAIRSHPQFLSAEMSPI